MDEINKILDDESKNDKQLIKDISVYIKNHLAKKLPINKKFIEDIINIVLQNSEVDFTGVVFHNDEDNIAAWVNELKALIFNLTKIVNSGKEINKELLNTNKNDRIGIYFYSLTVIIHEITHARQHYITERYKHDLYSTGESLINKNYMDYLLNHDLILIERYANLRAESIAYQVMTYVYPEEKVRDLREQMFYHLFFGYNAVFEEEPKPQKRKTNYYEGATIVSPIENYNSILETNEIEQINNLPVNELSLYARLYLGLPITTEELNNLNEMYMSIDDTPGDAKKLINKMNNKKDV